MNPFYKNISLWLVIVLMMIMLYNLFNPAQGLEKSVNYSHFLTMVENDEIVKVTIQGNVHCDVALHDSRINA